MRDDPAAQDPHDPGAVLVPPLLVAIVLSAGAVVWVLAVVAAVVSARDPAHRGLWCVIVGLWALFVVTSALLLRDGPIHPALRWLVTIEATGAVAFAGALLMTPGPRGALRCALRRLRGRARHDPRIPRAHRTRRAPSAQGRGAGRQSLAAHCTAMWLTRPHAPGSAQLPSGACWGCPSCQR